MAKKNNSKKGEKFKMLKTQNLIFLRVDPIEGVNATTKIPFAFANVTVSDGLESIELPLDFDLVPECKKYSKGDKIQVELNLVKQGYNFKVKITKVHKVA